MSTVNPISDNEFNIELSDDELIIIQAYCMSVESKPYALLKLVFETCVTLMASRLEPRTGKYGNPH